MGAAVDAAAERWAMAEVLLGQLRRDLQPNEVLQTSLLKGHARGGEWARALGALSMPNEKSFGAAADACASCGQWADAEELMRAMALQHVRLGTAAFNAATEALQGAELWRRALTSLELLRSTGLQLQASSHSTAASVCERSSNWEAALELFVLGTARRVVDLVACNGAISACATGQAAEQALAMMRTLGATQLQTDLFSFNAVIAAFAACSWRRGLDQLQLLGSRGLAADAVGLRALLSAGAALPWQLSGQLLAQLSTPSVPALADACAACAASPILLPLLAREPGPSSEIAGRDLQNCGVFAREYSGLQSLWCCSAASPPSRNTFQALNEAGSCPWEIFVRCTKVRAFQEALCDSLSRFRSESPAGNQARVLMSEDVGPIFGLKESPKVAWQELLKSHRGPRLRLACRVSARRLIGGARCCALRSWAGRRPTAPACASSKLSEARSVASPCLWIGPGALNSAVSIDAVRQNALWPAQLG
ncbi:unnamed protein product [Effrenium voratum]|nr:unnamed protein product [Effrenium voratum]